MQKSPANLSEAEKKSINAEMFKAAKNGNHDKVKELIDNGADPESTDPDWDDSNPDYSAPSALQAAIAANHFETVKVLLEKGLNSPSLQNVFTILMMSENPDINIVKLAENKGADLKYVDLGGDTIINLAVGRGHVEIVKYLSSKGVPYTLEGKNFQAVSKKQMHKKQHLRNHLTDQINPSLESLLQVLSVLKEADTIYFSKMIQIFNEIQIRE